MTTGMVARARRASGVLAAAGMAVISGCGGLDVGGGLPEVRPTLPPESQSRLPAQGEVIGQGETRVALLLPLTAEGNGRRIAAEFRNAARMAMDDAGDRSIELVIKDTKGTPEGATAAAGEAASEGAAAILGPVFAANVTAAASNLGPSRPIVVAFSTDRDVAGSGIYLNSFQPRGVIDRTLSYAVAQGYGRVVGIVPEGPAGDIAEARMRDVLPAAGGTAVATARYAYDNASVQKAVQDIAQSLEEADALFIPDGGNSPSAIVSALTGLGIDLSGKKLLGTGQWTTADLGDSALRGAWFADTDHDRVERFRTLYEERFDSRPSVNSALAYDTVVLAANIVRRFGEDGFRPSVIEDASGFSGYTGIFRFKADGTAERGFAIYEVTGEGEARVVSPAPTRFRAAS